MQSAFERREGSGRGVDGGRAAQSNPEILQELEVYVETQLSLLSDPATNWQPSDFLPELEGEDWLDNLKAMRADAALVPDDLIVTLVGNMITEEALPTYHAWLANLEHGFDRTGTGSNALALWTRGWVSEEKRHGDVLARWLLLSGRCDMRAVETTVQKLIGNGFDPQTMNSVYDGFVYTSFQERATQISHAGVAKRAREHGAVGLAKMCDMIAGDEARHGISYGRFVGKLFEIDPDGAMVAFARMMKAGITMPAARMEDLRDPQLFALFSAVTQRNGVYTARHYAEIIDRLVRMWNIESLSFETASGRESQEFIMGLAARLTRIAERTMERLSKVPPRPISWIGGRTLEYATA